MEQTIALKQFREQVARFQLVDVRSASEYAAGHIPGAVNMPLEQIESRLADLEAGRQILLVCQSGTRARLAAGMLEPCGKNIAVLEGGTAAWMNAGLPVVASVRTRWSLERQVRIGAGLLVLAGVILGVLISAYWLLLSGFVGMGLTFAGLTDICPMGILLGKMPWNHPNLCNLPGQTQLKAKEEL